MSDEFFKTRMGARFYEGTMPALVEAIQKATAAMNRLAEALEARGAKALELPCMECLTREAQVSLPWDRTRKVCEACYAELADGAPIAEADRIRRFPARPGES